MEVSATVQDLEIFDRLTNSLQDAITEAREALHLLTQEDTTVNRLRWKLVQANLRVLASLLTKYKVSNEDCFKKSFQFQCVVCPDHDN